MYRLRADSVAAYQRFLTRVVETEIVWHIRYSSNDEPLDCPSSDFPNKCVFPFWSAKAYASANAKKLEFEVTVEDIKLSRVREYWLPTMMEEGILAGPEWDRNFAGLEVDPKRLAGDLTALIASKP
jgi:hypothetical protein